MSGGSGTIRRTPPLHPGQLREGLQVGARAGPVGRRGEPPSGLAAQPVRPDRVQVVGAVLRVPDVEGAHAGELAHPLPVAPHARPHGGRAPSAGEPVGAAGDGQARGEPLDVPLPRAGERLVEVVDVEDQVPLGGGEQPEVQHVGVTAQLHRDPRVGRGAEIRGHDRRSAPVEAERRLQHAAVAERHQLRDPGRRLRLQDADRIGPLTALEPPMARTGHLGARPLPVGRPLGRSPDGGTDGGHGRNPPRQTHERHPRRCRGQDASPAWGESRPTTEQ